MGSLRVRREITSTVLPEKEILVCVKNLATKVYLAILRTIRVLASVSDKGESGKDFGRSTEIFGEAGVPDPDTIPIVAVRAVWAV